MLSARYFDPSLRTTVTRSHLPHWEQTGGIYFITWRLADSLPPQIWSRWLEARSAWLADHGIDPKDPEWRARMQVRLLPEERREFTREFSRQLETQLDAGLGKCLLREADNAKIVVEALKHFDGSRYQLGDFVIMPNHVHLLVGGMPRDRMLRQVEGWKRWTARRLNERQGRSGRVWQAEDFDHLVRDAAAHRRFARYIQENPRKAGLRCDAVVGRGSLECPEA
ncbi:MAG: transposase [Verrucomicrobia bacterium]|nr:transposase [Verrucomicrobiota bacterium]